MSERKLTLEEAIGYHELWEAGIEIQRQNLAAGMPVTMENVIKLPPTFHSQLCDLLIAERYRLKKFIAEAKCADKSTDYALGRNLALTEVGAFLESGESR